MAANPIDVKVHAPAGTIILNRPECCNALTHAMLHELQQALDDLQREKRVRVIVLTGSGDTFCAGMDAREIHAVQQDDDAILHWGPRVAAYRELLVAMLQTTKPIIAAVNGAAVAGGAGLVLASDVVVASSTAQFGVPEPRLGLVAGTIAPLLAFRVGSGQAARLLMTSTLVDAEEALRIGAFHELIDVDRVWARAMELAQDCAKAAPPALQLTKRLITETLAENLQTQLTAGAAAAATARTTDAGKEGVAAFLEKRDPVWE